SLPQWGNDINEGTVPPGHLGILVINLLKHWLLIINYKPANPQLRNIFIPQDDPDLCLVLYRDNTVKFTQLYRLTDGEWYDELKEDLENLLKLGVQIESITCDGHKALLKAIRKVCKQAVVQRCLVHIQRMCRIWLTASPQSRPGIELR